MSNISYLAIKTIIFYEIKDFLREYQHSIISPIISTVLFVFIFATLDRFYTFNTDDNGYINFLIPGIIMFVVMQTSYNHISEIIINMKQTGSFNDYLTSPVSRIEIYFSFLISSIIISLIIGYLNLLILFFFGNFENINYFNTTYYLILCIIIFSSFGALTGFLSFNWDSQSSISNFIIVPIGFFSGTFFSIRNIDKNFVFLLEFNPFYYLVSGFRSSFNYNNKISIYNDLYILITTFIIIFISLYVFKKGFRVIN